LSCGIGYPVFASRDSAARYDPCAVFVSAPFFI
jgi:hypothetical protein